jgi:zinc/manganese transport system substrate-binding protein
LLTFGAFEERGQKDWRNRICYPLTAHILLRKLRIQALTTRRDILRLGVGTGLWTAAAPVGAQARLRTAATFSILGDFVRNVAGERCDVAALVGPDGDVHVYEPTPADAKMLAAANLVFVNGLGLEGWITRLISASGTKAAVVTATGGITARLMARARDPAQTVPDPHAWQSAGNAKIYVANIRNALVAADAEGKTTYNANAASYLAKLDALDAEVRDTIGKIPSDRRKVITAHNAFGYFGAAYGIEFLAPEGVSTDAEPSAKDVAAIIGQIKREKISAVFLENVSDPRLMRQIAEETGARIGGTLYSDALSRPGGPAATYIDMMRHNARVLVAALTP